MYHIPRSRYRFNIIKFNRIKVTHATERAKLTKDRIRKIFFPPSLSTRDENTIPKTEKMSDGIQPDSKRIIKISHSLLKSGSQGGNRNRYPRIKNRTP